MRGSHRRLSLVSNLGEIRAEIVADPRRKVVIDGEIHECEGLSYKAHECKGALEMHHCLIPRSTIQKMRASEQRYFNDKRNISLVCSYFHENFAKAPEYEDHFHKRMIEIYGADTMADFWKKAPGKIMVEHRFKTVLVFEGEEHELT